MDGRVSIMTSFGNDLDPLGGLIINSPITPAVICGIMSD